MKTTDLLPTPETENLELLPKGEGANTETMKRADVPAIWQDYKSQVEKLKSTAETLTITDVSQVALMKTARETRLALKDIRVAVEKKRKELGEEALRQKQQIDTDARTIKDIIEPLEARLLEQEEFIERETIRLEDGKREARLQEITPHLSAPLAIDLGKLSDADYANLLQDTKDAHQFRLQREQKEREESEARAKAEAEERERVRLENERLKKEAAEREEATRKEREAAEVERKRLAQQVEDERKAASEKARKEREAVEAKAREEREAAEAIAKKEREAREKLEAEIAEKKSEQEREAKAQAESARVAAAAPDKKKLSQLAIAVRALTIPELNDANVKTLIESQRSKFAAWIEKQAEDL